MQKITLNSPTIMITYAIDYPPVVSRSEWLKARKEHLTQEKKLTQLRDELTTQRRELPMVKIEEKYAFDGPEGKKQLLDLFAGRHQLIVYHFMWLWQAGQPLEGGCRSCSGWVDQIAPGLLTGLHARSTSLVLISRAPWAKIAPFKQRMGWQLPWYSSAGTRFNFDFNVSFDESIAPMVYNYRTKEENERAGTAYYLQGEQPFDLHGLSCFLRKGDEVFHTYSSYGRGAESVGGGSYFLELTALGRQEEWEKPAGRVTGLGVQAGSEKTRYPDQYYE